MFLNTPVLMKLVDGDLNNLVIMNSGDDLLIGFKKIIGKASPNYIIMRY